MSALDLLTSAASHAFASRDEAERKQAAPADLERKLQAREQTSMRQLEEIRAQLRRVDDVLERGAQTVARLERTLAERERELKACESDSDSDDAPLLS